MNYEIEIKSTKELMHEAVQQVLDDFSNDAEDNLDFLLDMPKEDWVGEEDELTSKIDDAHDLVDDAKEQQHYFLKELDLNKLLDNSPVDEDDDKEVQSAINELKGKVFDYACTIENGEGIEMDEIEKELNEDIDDISYWQNEYKKLLNELSQND